MESITPPHQALTNSTAYTVISGLSAWLNHPITIKLARINAGGAWAMPHRWRDDAVHVTPALLAAPEEVQAQAAAHEVGHLVSGHNLRVVALAVTILIAVGIPAVPVEAGWVATREGLQLFGVVWCVWTVAVFLSAFLVWARVCRRHEVEADTLAAQWGYPLTKTCMEWIEATEPSLAKTRLYRPFRQHPLPHDRLSERGVR